MAAAGVAIKTLYIAGPMTGVPDWNYPAFNKAQAELEAAGFRVLNPARQPDGLTYDEYLHRAIADVFACEGIALLNGWEGSPGAKAEVALADALQKDASAVWVWLTLAKINKAVDVAHI